MTDHLAAAIGAADRLARLLQQLDQSARPSDFRQLREGVHIEVRLVRHHLRGLQEVQDTTVAAVTADTPGKVRADAPATSRAAAMVVRSGSARAKVLARLHTHAPSTDLQLQNALAMPANTERPRRGELVDAGLVYPTDRTIVHGGREWTVWALTRRGELVAASLANGVVKSIMVPTTPPPPEPSTYDTAVQVPTLF